MILLVESPIISTGKKINSDRIGNDKKMADRTDAKSAVQTELRIAPYIQTELRLIQIKIAKKCLK